MRRFSWPQRSRLLDWLDRGLTPAQRALPPEELSRYRVVLGATVLMGLLAIVYGLCLPLAPREYRLPHALSVLVQLSLLGGVWVLMRRGTSYRAPAFMLCASLTLGVLLGTMSVDQPGAASQASNMLVPVLAVYLLGPRRGFVFTLVFVINAAFFHELFHSGWGRTRPVFSNPLIWVNNLTASLSLLLCWGLSWLYSSSREESHVALTSALKTLRESESKLMSLIESTDDAVLSLDTHLRLVTANQIAQEVFFQATGRKLALGESVYALCTPELQEVLSEECGRAMAGHRTRTDVGILWQGQPRTMDVTFNPVRAGDQVVGVTVFSRDITQRKEAEARMSALHRGLMDASRQAGMAEIATGVLHNVGNTLNSVNVSVNLVIEQLRGSRAPGLERVVEMLRDNAPRLATFLVEDSRGRQLPAYLGALSSQLAQERTQILEEMGRLEESVERIRSVVSMQQRHARGSSVLEWVAVPSVLDEALRPHAVSFEALGIHLRRDYGPHLPRVLVDRHKLVQILDNLLSNARHALVERGHEGKNLTLSVAQVGGQLRIAVTDDGVGIAPDRLARLFTQGFPPRNDGHGFGLHLSALAAGDLGGSLSCASEGVGRGATFTLALPLKTLAPSGG